MKLTVPYHNRPAAYPTDFIYASHINIPLHKARNQLQINRNYNINLKNTCN